MVALVCPYQKKCWRYSYSKYLLEKGWSKHPPERYILFLNGYATGEQMKDGGKGGIFAERFPEKTSEGYKNICPCINTQGYQDCHEYKKTKKRYTRIREQKPFQRKRQWLSFELRQQVAARDKYKCVYCGVSVHHSKCHVDHIVPLAKGGSNEISNLCLACEACNLKKGEQIWHRDKVYFSSDASAKR